MARSSNPRLEQHWLRHLRRWQASHVTVRQYCQDHQLGEASFYAWRRTLQERGLLPEAFGSHALAARDVTASKLPLFLSVSAPSADASTVPIDVVLPDGLTVRVAAGFDAATLRQLLALLRESSC